MSLSISRPSRKLASAASMRGRESNTRKSRTKGKRRRNISSFNADLAESDCKHLGLKHIRTKPYTPKTSGIAERFIQNYPTRVGLRARLSKLTRARGRAADLAPPLQ